jgi:spermidine synthase
MSRAHLPALGAAFDDPRLTVHLTDGARFVARAAPERYDVVLVDSTDPIGPAKVLFQEPFYRGLRRALRPGGLLGAQAMSPWLQEREQREMFSELGRVWPHVHAYHATVPTYPGGQWVFAIAAEQAPDLTGYDRGRARTVALDCRYYTAELQLAAFHLPRFITQNTVDVAREARDERAADPPDPPTRHDREPDDRAWSN